jgi:hypothetical protein
LRGENIPVTIQRIVWKAKTQKRPNAFVEAVDELGTEVPLDFLVRIVLHLLVVDGCRHAS